MAPLLKISDATSLGLHAAVLLAQTKQGTVLTNRRIAKDLAVSEAHLSKVMQRLNRAGLVASIRGPTGGFVLQNDPHHVSLLAVYEAIEGTWQAPECLLPQKKCFKGCCLLGSFFDLMNQDAYGYFSKTMLSDIPALFCTADGIGPKKNRKHK